MQRASRFLSAALAGLPVGADIPDSEELRAALVALEFFVPQVLGEIYPAWKHESLDGIIAHVAQKTAQRGAEIYGLFIIISDQTTTPMHLRLEISPAADEFSWFEIRVGELAGGKPVREKWCLDAIPKRLRALAGRTEEIDWQFRVTFGERSH